MACFATPYGLHYAAYRFSRAVAQNNRQPVTQAEEKLRVT